MTAAAWTEVEIAPVVYVGPARRPLDADLAGTVVRTLVDQALGLPGMFELAFAAGERTDELLSVLGIGTEVAIAAASPERPGDPRLLIGGEVTTVQAEYGAMAVLVVRGYTAEHRLQRVRRTRTFVNMSDSDIAVKVAREAGLTVGAVTVTRAVHEHVGQLNQTDWEFLSGRAALLGLEVGVDDGEFFFGQRPAGAPCPLRMWDNLLAFAPRLSAAGLTTEVEVRAWDPLAATVVVERAGVAAADTAVGLDPHQAVARSNGSPPPPAPPAARPGAGRLGPMPSTTATVVGDQPRADRSAVRELATGLAQRVADSFADAVGESVGDPWLSAGRIVEVSGVVRPFAGRWLVTRARHELVDGRYRTTFEATGRQDRSLFGLAGPRADRRDRVPGVVCGIVSNNLDPLGKSRVKVILPWLSPDYESGWAVVAQPAAGEHSGVVLLPEVGDEVLVAFEFGDLQRPYVLGGVVNNRSTYSLGAPPVVARGNNASVRWRGLVTPSGSRLAFHDDVPAPGRVEQAEIMLGSADENLTLRIDQVAGAIALRCLPGQATRPGEKGRIVIECGPGGAIDVVAGAGGAVTIDGGGELTLKAQQLNLQGTRISVNGSGPVELKGKPIKLN
ncbi:phage baseplate assembly protein V [Kribbella sp. NPDC003557]|uniref:phage baseplate assembly protein V n=1 Tax=Kribbella sp. NPDC003557 TaxID=3154449 RepID=UPI0033A7D193